MVKRWIIRGSFILPILLCVGGWGWSYSHEDGVGHYGDSTEFNVESVSSYVKLEFTTYPDGVYKDDQGWLFFHNQTPEGEQHVIPIRQTHSVYYGDDAYFLGFDWVHARSDRFGFLSETRVLSVPYWFLMLVFSLALFLVWRKTRPSKLGGAFPVELVEKHA